MKKCEIFAVSDVHGHSSILKKALKDAGFRENDPTHLLVGLGDYFDRGQENADTLEYLSSIENKVLVRGNHEDMLLSCIYRGRYGHNEVCNGTDVTLLEFFGEENVSADGTIIRNEHTEKVKERLIGFINSTVNYFESDNYVFVHGWVPTDYFDGVETVKPMWRRSTDSDWSRARFLEWNKQYAKGLTIGKTIVCGHRPAAWGAFIDNTRSFSDSSVFYADKMIAIDATTVNSGRVNVLRLSDRI